MRGSILDYELIKKLYGIEEFQGCLAEDMDYLEGKYGTLPKHLTTFFAIAGETKELNCVQDETKLVGKCADTLTDFLMGIKEPMER